MRIGKFGVLTLFMAIAGCDCNKTSAQIQARHLMVATVLATPEIVIKREAIAGLDDFLGQFDASIPYFDGGIPFEYDGGCPFEDGCAFDAGILPISFDQNGVTFAPQTAVLAFFGTREGDGFTSAPVGVSDATLSLTNGVTTWPLDAQGGGAHTLTSQDDATLLYVPGANYAFSATSMGQEYVGEIRETPTPEAIAQLHPEAGYIELDAGSPYTLTRPDPPPGQQRLYGFVSVLPISANGDQGSFTYTNVPTTPIKALELVAGPSEWRKTVIEIPADAFPQPDRNYLILFQTAQLGFASSSNLFIGSPMIAGVADVGIVKTKK
ncbi:MAG: hypothetical protein JNK82_25135 [Myxococcaceae bacterium]|nr:hypothetical protein [Myxococcaceae bacterium]